MCFLFFSISFFFFLSFLSPYSSLCSFSSLLPRPLSPPSSLPLCFFPLTPSSFFISFTFFVFSCFQIFVFMVIVTRLIFLSPYAISSTYLPFPTSPHLIFLSLLLFFSLLYHLLFIPIYHLLPHPSSPPSPHQNHPPFPHYSLILLLDPPP